MTDAPDLSRLADELAARIQQELPTFEGRDLRADAGEGGIIYIALRRAKKAPEAGERLAARLEHLLDAALEGTPAAYAISLGRGDRDLLFHIELRRT